MANIGNFVFFDETSTERVSNPYSNPNNAGAITLAVEDLGSNSTISLTVKGLNDLTSPDAYFPIKGIGLGDFNSYTTITSPGLYMFPCDGIYRIRLESSVDVGNIKAYCVAVG